MRDPLVEALQQRKKAAGVPWEVLAVEIGMDHEALLRLARGGHDPTCRALKKIAIWLGWGPGETGKAMLFDRSGQKPVFERKRRGKR